MKVSQPRTSDRVRQTLRLLQAEGARRVGDRIRTRIADKIRPSLAAPLPVSIDEFTSLSELESNSWQLPSPRRRDDHEPLLVAWLCTPPSAGSGGHTTIFRMVGALEQAGHECVIYIRDDHGWSLRQHEATIREWWPWVRAEVRDARQGVDDCDAIFATSWQTAWGLLPLRATGARCYFVQDFEPSFYPAGSEYLLAEQTYSFPFQIVTAGKWLAEKLRSDYGAQTQYFDFGCDAEQYRFDSDTLRTDICYYSRPSTPRRAHELAIAGLELFARSNPRVVIHTYGEYPGRLAFAHHHHGLLAPARLNDLYNRCAAGLVLSATNVSLVPHEMLTAGCIPVVNESKQNRTVLANDQVEYCPPLPHAIAGCLTKQMCRSSFEREAAARTAAASVATADWRYAENQFVNAVVGIVVPERRQAEI
jgi:O-antigen biosynthesis protein